MRFYSALGVYSNEIIKSGAVVVFCPQGVREIC